MSKLFSVKPINNIGELDITQEEYSPEVKIEPVLNLTQLGKIGVYTWEKDRGRVTLPAKSVWQTEWDSILNCWIKHRLVGIVKLQKIIDYVGILASIVGYDTVYPRYEKNVYRGAFNNPCELLYRSYLFQLAEEKKRIMVKKTCYQLFLDAPQQATGVSEGLWGLGIFMKVRQRQYRMSPSPSKWKEKYRGDRGRDKRYFTKWAAMGIKNWQVCADFIGLCRYWNKRFSECETPGELEVLGKKIAFERYPEFLLKRLRYLYKRTQNYEEEAIKNGSSK